MVEYLNLDTRSMNGHREVHWVYSFFLASVSYSTALKSSRAARPESIDGGPKGQAPLVFWKKGKDFKFKDLSLSVTFAECSARGKGEEDVCSGEIGDVKVWLDKLC